MEWFRSHTTTLSPSPTLFPILSFVFFMSHCFPYRPLLSQYRSVLLSVKMIIKLNTHLLRHAAVLRIYPFYEKNAFCSRIFKSCLFLKHPSSAVMPCSKPCSNDSGNYPAASSSELSLQLAMPTFASARDLLASNIILLKINGQRLQINFNEVKFPETYTVCSFAKEQQRNLTVRTIETLNNTASSLAAFEKQVFVGTYVAHIAIRERNS